MNDTILMVRRRGLGFTAACVLLAGCADEPTVPLGIEPEFRETAPSFAVQLTCSVDVQAASMECEPSSPSVGNGPSANLVVGSQHRFVRLANTTPDVWKGVWSANVTVQNLTLQPMATADGSTPHPDGVHVFFVDEPDNGVEVINHDGVGLFVGSGTQKFYRYAGSTLGADGILSQGETSAAKKWEFELNGATTFRFSVLVSTTVPDPNVIGVHLTRVVTGAYHACGDGADGKVYCWGHNYYGQLGDGTTEQRKTPVAAQTPADVTFTRVSVGVSRSCAESSGGRVFCWGSNNFGQLGDSTYTNRPTPVEVRAPAGVRLTRVTSGIYHSCAEGSDGKVYCWGRNDSGQLGAGAPTGSPTPIAVTPPTGVSFTGVSAGASHTCARGSNGKAYCWGYNGSGQIGDGSTAASAPITPVAAPVGVTFSDVAAGFSHTCALGSDTKLYCWGENSAGGLGNGTLTRSVLPTEVSLPDVDILGVSAGALFTCAATAEAAYCWGSGSFGQLGDGRPVNRSVPVIVAGTRGA